MKILNIYTDSAFYGKQNIEYDFLEKAEFKGLFISENIICSIVNLTTNTIIISSLQQNSEDIDISPNDRIVNLNFNVSKGDRFRIKLSQVTGARSVKALISFIKD